MEQTEERTGVSRRKVVVGVAWTVPAIIVASALPAYAASTTVLRVFVASFTDDLDGTAPVVTFRFETSDQTTVKVATDAVFKVVRLA